MSITSAARNRYPPFDSFFDVSSSSYSVNTSETAEVLEFGDSSTSAKHFTNYSLRRATGDSSQTISSDQETHVNLMNPCTSSA